MRAIYGNAMEMLAHTERQKWQADNSLHRRIQSICKVVGRWLSTECFHRKRCTSLRGEKTRSDRAAWRWNKHSRQKVGDGIGYSGYKHQKGEKVMAITDNNGYVLSPLPVALVNKSDMVLLPDGLKSLKLVAKM